MSEDQNTRTEEQVIPGESSAGPIVLELAAGAAAGALTGAIAGPPGAVIGALIGGAVSVAAGVVREDHAREEQRHEAELDRAIGVDGGNIGEASPDQPPPRHGLLHADALGISSGGQEPSDGIIQNVDAAK
jgi:hypothetical protein